MAVRRAQPGRRIGPVLVAGAFAFMAPIAVWATARRIAKQYPSACGLQTRIPDAEGLHSTGNGVALALPWHAIERCTETDEFFLFHHTKQLACHLGKSHSTERQRASVRALIETHSVRAAGTHA